MSNGAGVVQSNLLSSALENFGQFGTWHQSGTYSRTLIRDYTSQLIKELDEYKQNIWQSTLTEHDNGNSPNDPYCSFSVSTLINVLVKRFVPIDFVLAISPARIAYDHIVPDITEEMACDCICTESCPHPGNL